MGNPVYMANLIQVKIKKIHTKKKTNKKNQQNKIKVMYFAGLCVCVSLSLTKIHLMNPENTMTTDILISDKEQFHSNHISFCE